MQKSPLTTETTNHNCKIHQPQERRKDNRRKVARDGYTYVPIVGWYCRRAKARRNGVDKP